MSLVVLMMFGRLRITNIDIQSVVPVDQRTRDSLQKSVQLAIKITTKSQEAAARHEAELLKLGSRGRLECQKIHYEAQAELARKDLLQLQAQPAAFKSTAQATKIRSESEISLLKAKRENELSYLYQNSNQSLNLKEEIPSNQFLVLVMKCKPNYYKVWVLNRFRSPTVNQYSTFSIQPKSTSLNVFTGSCSSSKMYLNLFNNTLSFFLKNPNLNAYPTAIKIL
ncbi:hypothetical protein ACTFIY_004459 [Dictyostelium cf. discoideum]